jgi:hypothetical protein
MSALPLALRGVPGGGGASAPCEPCCWSLAFRQKPAGLLVFPQALFCLGLSGGSAVLIGCDERANLCLGEPRDTGDVSGIAIMCPPHANDLAHGGNVLEGIQNRRMVEVHEPGDVRPDQLGQAWRIAAMASRRATTIWPTCCGPAVRSVSCRRRRRRWTGQVRPASCSGSSPVRQGSRCRAWHGLPGAFDGGGAAAER